MNLDNSGPKLPDFASRPPGSRTFCVVYECSNYRRAFTGRSDSSI